MPSPYFPFTLRLYGYVLYRLSDHNFTGLDLFYRIKDCWKGRDEPTDLLLRPLVPGLSYKIGEWCFDAMFNLESQGESTSKPYFKTLDPEDFMWWLEDVIEAACHSELFGDSDLISAIIAQTNEINNLYDAVDDRPYWNKIAGDGRRKLIKMFKAFCRDLCEPLSQMKKEYAHEIADRILHDRQLCNFIAQRLMDIGFDGENSEGLRTQWVNREKWRARVKSILFARDRGKCALCNTDIVYELRAEAHIDHMFPIAQGGCNDLVNLQLLCSQCNLQKSDNKYETTSSIPIYIRRTRKPASS